VWELYLLQPAACFDFGAFGFCIPFRLLYHATSEKSLGKVLSNIITYRREHMHAVVCIQEAAVIVLRSAS
jgi:hypothetical protein